LVNLNTVSPPILIVEDHDDTREMVETLVSSDGYRVCTAAHGLEALECIAREAPCLILLDLTMPVMDGPTFARLLRAYPDPAVAQTPIILLTAMPYGERMMRDIGAVELIPKPINLSQVLEACARHCPPSVRMH
jgi:two-component system sensor histidine kinase ChiS